MNSASVFGAEDAARYAKIMVERESRGWGDHANALRSVGRRCGMSARSLHRLIKGERKDGGVRVLPRVRAAYLDHCAVMIAKLQAEIEVDRTRFGNAAVADLENEVSALAAKLDAARKARA